MVALSSDCLRLGRVEIPRHTLVPMVHLKKPIIFANNCVTCKCKVKILEGVPASGPPVVPTPLYKCSYMPGDLPYIIVI